MAILTVGAVEEDSREAAQLIIGDATSSVLLWF